MQQKRFYLTKKQTEIVLPLLEAAEKDCYEKNEYGAVLFQIKRNGSDSRVWATGNYFPAKCAERIAQVLLDFKNKC